MAAKRHKKHKNQKFSRKSYPTVFKHYGRNPKNTIAKWRTFTEIGNQWRRGQKDPKSGPRTGRTEDLYWFLLQGHHPELGLPVSLFRPSAFIFFGCAAITKRYAPLVLSKNLFSVARGLNVSGRCLKWIFDLQINDKCIRGKVWIVSIYHQFDNKKTRLIWMARRFKKFTPDWHPFILYIKII